MIGVDLALQEVITNSSKVLGILHNPHPLNHQHDTVHYTTALHKNGAKDRTPCHMAHTPVLQEKQGILIGDQEVLTWGIRSIFSGCVCVCVCVFEGESCPNVSSKAEGLKWESET